MQVTMFHRLRQKLRTGGIAGAVQAGLLRLLGEKPTEARRIIRVLRDRVGIEIGGPSSFFARYGLLPIYPLVGRVDNVNFRAETVWEGSIREGLTFRYNRALSAGLPVHHRGGGSRTRSQRDLRLPTVVAHDRAHGQSPPSPGRVATGPEAWGHPRGRDPAQGRDVRPPTTCHTPHPSRPGLSESGRGG